MYHLLLKITHDIKKNAKLVNFSNNNIIILTSSSRASKCTLFHIFGIDADIRKSICEDILFITFFDCEMNDYVNELKAKKDFCNLSIEVKLATS